MNLVNGYVCKNCTDVEAAKRGVDPAHPERGVQGLKSSANGDDDAKGLTAKADDEREKKWTLGANRPVDSGDVGTRLNLLG